MKRVLMILFLGIFLASFASAATIYVSTTGTDSSTCGGSSSPCRHIEYAVEKRAISGDLVKVYDGTYIENSITFPLGVSLTAVNYNYPNPTVKIIPSSSMWVLLDMRSIPPVKEGNHEISYIDIVGTGTQYGIDVEDRSNIHIHHCYLHDHVDHFQYTRAIRVVSTEAAAYGSDWTQLVPYDGRDINAWLALWKFDPVKNIEIDHVKIIDWGRIPFDNKASGGGIQPVGWNGGSIHDSYFEATDPGHYIKFIQATGSFIRNVDIYNNQIISHNIGSNGSVWSIELWGHINNRIFNNSVNLPFSLTYGYGTEVFNNNIIAESAKSVGIEGIGQSNYWVYNNYVVNGGDGGINVGMSGNLDYIMGNIDVFGNVIERVWYKPVCIYATNHYNYHIEIHNISIHHNTASKISHFGNYFLMDNRGGGTIIVDDVRFENNIVTDAVESGGKFVNVDNLGTLGSYKIENNLYHGCGTNAFTGLTETNAIVKDPLFVADTSLNVVDEYKLRQNSPAIDAGVDLGLRGKDLWGNNYDAIPNIGAFQGLSSLGTTPTCPQGKITSICLCSETSYSSGYCCSGTWQELACSHSACSSDADSDGNSEVSINELINFISSWKEGSVTIGDLINAIGEWKNGC